MAKTDCDEELLKTLKLLAEMKLTGEQQTALLRGLKLLEETKRAGEKWTLADIEEAMNRSGFIELYHGARKGVEHMESPLKVNDAFGTFTDAKQVIDALQDVHTSGSQSTEGSSGWWEVINSSLKRVSEMLDQGLTEMSESYDDLEHPEA